MAAHMFKTGLRSWAAGARAEFRAPSETADVEVFSRGRSAAGLGVAAAAILLAGAPGVVAVIAIVSPGELDRAFGWLAGGTVAFSLVAAGRVPAATLLTLLTLALAGVRARR